MAKTKISTLAKDLNVALPTVIELLRTKDNSIDESPNTRVDDNVVELLMNEFKHDKDLKNQSARRPQKPAPAAPAPKAEVKVQPEAKPAGPRILGRLELDAKGNPIVKKPEAPKPAPVAAPTPAPAPAPVEKPAPAPAPEPKLEPRPAPKPEEKKPETPKPAPEKPAPAAPVKPAAQAEKPAEPKKVTPAPVKAAEPVREPDKDPEVFVPERTVTGPTINVIGKIDLDAINQSTRPKKKSKEERRNDRNNSQGDNSQNDRKKRKRSGGK